MIARSIAACVVLGVLVTAGCIGGQSEPARQTSDALGDRSRDVPPATLQERDWKEAAKGHAAAGPIPAAELVRMERRSAPGGNLDVDASAGDASAPASRASK